MIWRGEEVVVRELSAADGCDDFCDAESLRGLFWLGDANGFVLLRMMEQRQKASVYICTSHAKQARRS